MDAREETAAGACQCHVHPVAKAFYTPSDPHAVALPAGVPSVVSGDGGLLVGDVKWTSISSLHKTRDGRLLLSPNVRWDDTENDRHGMQVQATRTAEGVEILMPLRFWKVLAVAGDPQFYADNQWHEVKLVKAD